LSGNSNMGAWLGSLDPVSFFILMIQSHEKSIKRFTLACPIMSNQSW
jgi:hypothetical protein